MENIAESWYNRNSLQASHSKLVVAALQKAMANINASVHKMLKQKVTEQTDIWDDESRSIIRSIEWNMMIMQCQISYYYIHENTHSGIIFVVIRVSNRLQSLLIVAATLWHHITAALISCSLSSFLFLPHCNQQPGYTVSIIWLHSPTIFCRFCSHLYIHMLHQCTVSCHHGLTMLSWISWFCLVVSCLIYYC